MKQKMAMKIKKPAADELKKFDQLPIAKAKIEEPKDAVSEFLERATKQEAQERAVEAQKNKDPVTTNLIQAAHKDISDVDESIESNPLTELYLQKHPKLLEAAHETDWSSVANGDDQS